MRKVLFLLIISSLFYISCVSTALVPGAEAIEVENLYKEYFSLADNYNELKKYDKAETYYKKASKLKELYWPCLYKLSDIYLKQSRWQDAEDSYKQLINRDGDNLLLKECLAFVYASSGKMQDALDLYETFINTNDISQGTFENYIILLISTENYEKAENKLNEFSELYPDNTNIPKYKEKISSVLNKKDPETENTVLDFETPSSDPDSFDFKIKN